MNTLFPAPRLFPPGVAERELDAGVDAWVAVSERGAGDVDGVGAEVNGAAGAKEVVNTDSALRCKVPDAGVGVGAVVLLVVGWAAECRILVVRPEEPPSGLTPEGESFGTDYVPTKNDGSDGYSSEGASYRVEG